MIHLALLDDHPAVLAGLRRLIEHEPDLLIVGAAPNASQLAREIGEQRADVLVLDHDLARSDGLAHCRRIKDRPHPPAVIIYSAFASAALALAARVAHADAVVDKTEPVSRLLAAIRSVAAGETVLPAIPRDAYETATARLNHDDLPILAMLLGGESLPAIADAMRTDRAEIAWRAQRIIGRLRPAATSRTNGHAAEGGAAPVPELPSRSTSGRSFHDAR
jgi:DNA-binding NarL/FixJ family response regulator